MRLTLISLAAAASLLAACSSTPPAQAPQSVPPAPNMASTSSNGAAANATRNNAVDQAALEAQRQTALRQQQLSELNAQSVLFDFDDYTVKPDYTSLLQKEADFLKAQGSSHLILQGNSDERGGAEYNLALGQKRADAVRKALVLLGAPQGRIETISFGKEKPKATCPDESCWAQNRRVDFVNDAGAQPDTRAKR